MDLNQIMETDHVIRVVGGAVTDRPDQVEGVYAPEIHLEADWDEHGDAHVTSEHERAMVEHARQQGWEIFQGRVSHGLSLGPIIEPSYFIGGALEELIREIPGYWVAVAVDVCPADEDAESQGMGWALAHREAL